MFAALECMSSVSEGQSLSAPMGKVFMETGNSSGLMEWLASIDGEAVLAHLRRFNLPEELMSQVEDLVSYLDIIKMYY
jgi:hypothetical protein